MMDWIEHKLLGKPMTGPVEHRFCSRCGGPMARRTFLRSKGYDRHTGEPLADTREALVCINAINLRRPDQMWHDGWYLLDGWKWSA